jgi:hypothetical protein
VVWLTGVSISLNAVSGRSAMGMTETKLTAVARRRRNAQHPKWEEDIAGGVGCQGLLRLLEVVVGVFRVGFGVVTAGFSCWILRGLC